MSRPIISFEDLGKRYQLRHQASGQSYVALRDVIAGLPSRIASKLKGGLRGQSGTSTEEFWALRHINLDVQPGEVVGIIGRNGAGKSTLLKVLSRITDPTEGKVTIRGRVASLLEVGTGFHPELTGRENIFLNGAILGMSRNEIRRKFDEIVAFAEVEQFLDTPVKRYSSGMYVRLAFAVAAHLEPEILVVDEVLAVGDAAFQKKCLGKMQNVAGAGRTVLFVSHNMTAINALCKRGVVIDQGQVVFSGSADEATKQYSEHHQICQFGEYRPSAQKAAQRAGKAHIVLARVTSPSQEGTGYFPCGSDLVFTIHCSVPVGSSVCLGLGINSRMGERVVTAHSSTQQTSTKSTSGELRFECRLSQVSLVPGTYMVKVALDCLNTGYEDDAIDDAFSFEIVNSALSRQTKHSHKGVAIYEQTWGIDN